MDFSLIAYFKSSTILYQFPIVISILALLVLNAIHISKMFFFMISERMEFDLEKPIVLAETRFKVNLILRAYITQQQSIPSYEYRIPQPMAELAA